MQQKNYETGRSMVEMLGVLAVMGVLSIGAVMGFNYGMNKHRANQVLSDIRLIYQETRIPSVMHNIVNNNSLPENLEIEQQSAYEYSFSFPDLDDFIYDSSEGVEHNLLSVNVENVPQGVCDILLQNKPSYVLMLKVNGKSVWSCDADTNEMNYVFEASSDSLEVGTCSICTDSHCFDDDFNCPEGLYCYNDTCSKCAPDYTEDKNGKCTKCHTAFTTNFSQNSCLRCNNTIYGYKLHIATGCLGCDKGVIRTTKENCTKRCGHIDDIHYIDQYCFTCSGFDYVWGFTKEECNTCPDTIWYPKTNDSQTGLCINCANNITNASTNEDKTACICSGKKFWNFNTGSLSACSDCSVSATYYSSKTECDKCSERYFTGSNERNGECKLCPEGQVKSDDGKSCITQ